LMTTGTAMMRRTDERARERASAGLREERMTGDVPFSSRKETGRRWARQTGSSKVRGTTQRLGHRHRSTDRRPSSRTERTQPFAPRPPAFEQPVPRQQSAVPVKWDSNLSWVQSVRVVGTDARLPLEGQSITGEKQMLMPPRNWFGKGSKDGFYNSLARRQRHSHTCQSATPTLMGPRGGP
jgi:hypothetical protein